MHIFLKIKLCWYYRMPEKVLTVVMIGLKKSKSHLELNLSFLLSGDILSCLYLSSRQSGDILSRLYLSPLQSGDLLPLMPGDILNLSPLQSGDILSCLYLSSLQSGDVLSCRNLSSLRSGGDILCFRRWYSLLSGDILSSLCLLCGDILTSLDVSSYPLVRGSCSSCGRACLASREGDLLRTLSADLSRLGDRKTTFRAGLSRFLYAGKIVVDGWMKNTIKYVKHSSFIRLVMRIRICSDLNNFPGSELTEV